MGNDTISVQIVFALPGHVWLRDLSLPGGTTITQALDASEFWHQHSDMVPDQVVVGIYGQVCDHAQVLKTGDRIEVYRPLVFDPMESRRRRAIHRQGLSSI